MRILMPFWYLDIFDRYIPQMKTISERIDEFHIAYVTGAPKKKWNKWFDFHKVRIGYDRIKSITIRWWLSRGKIYSQIRDIDVDLYYCLSGFWVQELSRYCALKKNKPYIVRLRGDHRVYRDSINAPWWKKRFFNYYETRSMKDANLIIPISRKLAKLAKKWGVHEDKIADPIPVGINTKSFRPLEIEKYPKFTVGYAGRISPEKRVHSLIETAKKLPEVNFVICGLWQLKKKWDLPVNVEYLGLIDFGKMPEFFNKIHLFALPSISEGFPNVILQAYACGTPVIVSKEAFPEEIEVFGSVVDITEFETEIRRLRSLDLKTIGEKARKHIEKRYTWEKFGSTILNYLESVANQVS